MQNKDSQFFGIIFSKDHFALHSVGWTGSIAIFNQLFPLTFPSKISTPKQSFFVAANTAVPNPHCQLICSLLRFTAIVPLHNLARNTGMKPLKEQIELVRSAFYQAIQTAHNLHDLEQIRISYLGRSGSIAHLMDQLKAMPAEEKRTYGPLIQEFKNAAQETFDEHKNRLQHQLDQRAQLQKEHFDVTATRHHPLTGSLHVYTHIIEQLEDIFISMGYTLADGPEVENDYYNFTAVNVPENHPARDMQDTFWIHHPHSLLRTHTTSVQVHTMEKQTPPYCNICPG